MGLFGQFANVVEWEEYREDVLFWKWSNREIKKGSRLVIRQGQDAVFLYNGRVEGIFTEEGSFDIESDIIPVLSTLKGFKFGFNSGIRAEVLFINTKEMTVKWGTKNAILIPSQALPGGLPVRSFGTFQCKIANHDVLIEKVAGIRQQYTIEEVKERVISMLDQLLMKWITREGRDMFNLQANAHEIAKGIQEDLDMEMYKIGIAIPGFAISSFSFPEEVQKMAEKAASQSMVGDMNRYTQIAMADSMGKPNTGGSAAGNLAGFQMGMAFGQQMVNQVQMGTQPNRQAVQPGYSSGRLPENETENSNTPVQNGNSPKFCPECGTKNMGSKFCPECGNRLF